MKRLLFLINPRSGKEQLKGKMVDILDLAVKAGYTVEVHVTQSQGDARRVAAERGWHYDLVICSGGDGTLNETVSGLMDGPRIPEFGYIPSGSTNDFASSLGLSKDGLKAAEDVFAGSNYPLDVGKFGEDRYFVYIAAFGAFTEVSYVTPQDRKNLLGHQAYMLEAVKRLTMLRSYAMKVETEDRQVEGEFILGMVTNTMQVGGFKGLVSRDVALNDGEFEVLLIRKPKTPKDLHSIVMYLLMREGDEECVYQFRAKKLRVTSPEPVDWTLDGEFGGSVSQVDICNLEKSFVIRRPPEFDKNTKKTAKNVLKNAAD